MVANAATKAARKPPKTGVTTATAMVVRRPRDHNQIQ
jgi:hypothetical protein